MTINQSLKHCYLHCLTVKSIKIEGSVHNVQISPDGKILGATVVPEMSEHGEHSGHEEKINGYALFYDVESDKLLHKVEVGAHPAHIVFTENRKYALVTFIGCSIHFRNAPMISCINKIYFFFF